MNITIYKNSGDHLTRDYDLSVISVQVLTKALYSHCEALEAVPSAAAVTIPEEILHVIKTNTKTMSMQEVAEEILKIYQKIKK